MSFLDLVATLLELPEAEPSLYSLPGQLQLVHADDRPFAVFSLTQSMTKSIASLPSGMNIPNSWNTWHRYLHAPTVTRTPSARALLAAHRVRCVRAAAGRGEDDLLQVPRATRGDRRLQ